MMMMIRKAAKEASSVVASKRFRTIASPIIGPSIQQTATPSPIAGPSIQHSGIIGTSLHTLPLRAPRKPRPYTLMKKIQRLLPLSEPTKEEELRKSDIATLYLCESNHKTWGSKARCNWHVIDIKEGFELEHNQQLPPLDMLDNVFFEIRSAMLGSRLFVTGGCCEATRQVYSIDTLNSGDGWRIGSFVRSRCSPHLVLFEGSLYAFGYSLDKLGYYSKADDEEELSHPWAEVYDECENKWKPVKLEFLKSSNVHAVPSYVTGDLVDKEGKLILLSGCGAVRCDIVKKKGGHYCKARLIQAASEDCFLLNPGRIGHLLCETFSTFGMRWVSCFDLNTNQFSAGPPPHEIEQKGPYIKFGYRKIIPLTNDALYMIQLFHRYKKSADKYEPYLLYCVKIIPGPNGLTGCDLTRNKKPTIKVSKIRVQIPNFRTCMIVRGDTFAFSSREG